MRSGAGAPPGRPRGGGVRGELPRLGRRRGRAELASLGGTVPSPPYRLREAGGPRWLPPGEAT